MQSVWDSLPLEIRSKAEKLKRENGQIASEVLDFLIGKLADAQSSTSTRNETKKSTTKSIKQNFDKNWQVSQILPTRKSVTLCVSPTKLATYKVSDGELCDEGDWSTFNVFLKLPIPKRPKLQYNLVLARLGGTGPFLVLSSTDSCEEITEYFAKHAKYTDTSASVSQVVPAYIGARDGLLYLLNDFLFFGFRKPLQLFLLAEIESISITVVTSRTFNIFVKLLDDTTHEFEKLPHEYSQLIMDYIAKHNLNDTSMAEERRAKRQKTQPSALEEAVQDATNASAESIHGGEEGEENDESDDESDDEDFESGSEST